MPTATVEGSKTLALGRALLDMAPARREALLATLDRKQLQSCLTALDNPAIKRYAISRAYIDRPVEWLSDQLGDFLWSKQREIYESVVVNRYTAVSSCHGVGKGLALDTPLPTPAGWTTMGQVRAGDMLLDEAGRPCRVTWASPIRHRDCYQVFFSDGSRLTTDDEHRWSTLTLDRRHAARERCSQRGQSAPADWRDHWDLAEDTTTPLIAGTLRSPIGQYRHAVPTTRALDLPDAELPIDPYVLGAWLGDGTSCRPEITCADREIIDRIAASGENVRRRERTPYAWVMTGALPDRPLLLSRLRALGVLNAKHIPDLYARASASQRLEVLRGLMDTDGTVAVNGRCSIDLCDERLAEDLAELVRSLGWLVSYRKEPATMASVEVGIRWRMSFRPDVCPFHLPRKAARWSPPGPQASRWTIRTVTAVEPTVPVPTRCLTVDSPRSLFLAGRDMIPTHNSFSAARLALWWIEAHPPGTAFVVTTAPTGDQVRGVLWREMNRGHAKGGLAGRIGVAQWTLEGQLVAVGRKPANTNAAAFQGIHDEYVLVIIDEADGVAPAIFDAAADTLATNETARVLAIGNPDSASGPFADACSEGSEWHVIYISAFDSPNFTGEAVPDQVARTVVSKQWVEERRRKWGEDDPRWQSKVLGRKPLDNPVGVIPYQYLTKAIRGQTSELPHRLYVLDDNGQRIFDPAVVQAATVSGDRDVHVAYQWEKLGPSSWGVDIGAGSDKTVVWEQRNRVLCRTTAIRSIDPEFTARHIEQWALEVGAPTDIKIDMLGVGWGIAGALRILASQPGSPLAGVPIHMINVGRAGKAPTGTREGFRLLRDEVWWEMRTALVEGSIDLRILDDDDCDEIWSEFLDPTWAIAQGGRITVSPKHETRDRLGHSPDDADAIILAFHEPRMQGSLAAATEMMAGMTGVPGQLTPSYPAWVLGKRVGSGR